MNQAGEPLPGEAANEALEHSLLKAEDIKELALQFKDHSVEEELSETRIVYIGTNPKNQRILYHDDRKRQPGETRLWTERTYEFHPDGRIVYNEHDNDNWTQWGCYYL